MRISVFMHEINNFELIKRLHDNIPKLVYEMMRVTTAFLRGEVAASNQARKKTLSAWKQQEARRKQNFDRRGDVRNQQRSERRRNKFTLLTKSPKEILALDKGKFKTPPPMTTPVEKRNNNKFCEFHGEVRHNTNECMHLKRQIEELIKAGKLSHVIKELKQGSGMDQPKTAKKGEAFGKDKAMAILMEEYSHCKVARLSHSNARWSQPSAITRAAEERIKVAIHLEYPKQTIAIGSTLTKEGQKELCDLLRHNLDIFAWKPADMTGVPRHIAEHRLNVREGCPPVRQRKRSQALERNKAIREEVEKLVDVGIIKEVHYHTWLLNPIMVKKYDNNWRMCMDFKDINKACLKDGYSLLEIDWKVESLCGYPFKCFLDAYKGYHQIKMAKEDEEKTTFITSHGIFCYLKIPFGLKNAGETYQHLVDKAF
ncbi:hypothetical protein Tco_0821650 [Tanacetum coccineum]|uniref:Reverse transcriptase domain-containing protein n=1 Tax=Tanacetum coccineum TaxID=301880 RepID=A0ABQ5AH30_9ASTR